MDINSILSLTKQQKIEIFSKLGIVIEIQEDPTNLMQDGLVVYTKGIREPFSFHLLGKFINNENRDLASQNRLIRNSRLDNKNPSLSSQITSYDCNLLDLDFSPVFQGKLIGKVSAVLANLLKIDIPAMLFKYGITEKVINNLLNNNIKLTTENIYDYVPKIDGISPEDVINIVNGIRNMIEHLKRTQELKVPEDMPLDEEYEYLKNYSFRNIHKNYIPDIISLLGNNKVKYEEVYERKVFSILDRELEILKSDNHSEYQDTLKDIIMKFTTPTQFPIREGMTEGLYFIGDENIQVGLDSKKVKSLLDRILISVDMSKINDEIYQQRLEFIINHHIMRRAKLPANTEEARLSQVNALIAQIQTGSYMNKKSRIKIINIGEEWKKSILGALEGEKKTILSRMESNDKFYFAGIPNEIAVEEELKFRR